MSPQPSFSELVRRARKHDEAAAAELVRQFHPQLRRVVSFHLTDSRLRRLVESLDVCQSVFAAFFVHLYGGKLDLTQPKHLAALLALMGRNKVVDHARRNRREKDRVREGVAYEESVADPRARPCEDLERRELLDAVMEQLSESDRDLLKRWLAGEEWAKIGRAVGCGPDAARKRFSRAIDEAAGRLGLLESMA